VDELQVGSNVRVEGWRGVAFWVKEVQDETAKVVMVGDDQIHTVHIEDCTPLAEEDFCAECGQIGCNHDGRGSG